MKGKKAIKSGELEAFLGKNTSFEGKMAFEGMQGLMVSSMGRFFPGIYSLSVKPRSSMARSTSTPSSWMER